MSNSRCVVGSGLRRLRAKKADPSASPHVALALLDGLRPRRAEPTSSDARGDTAFRVPPACPDRHTPSHILHSLVVFYS
jgi:hypothetical protein